MQERNRTDSDIYVMQKLLNLQVSLSLRKENAQKEAGWSDLTMRHRCLLQFVQTLNPQHGIMVS